MTKSCSTTEHITTTTFLNEAQTQKLTDTQDSQFPYVAYLNLLEEHYRTFQEVPNNQILAVFCQIWRQKLRYKANISPIWRYIKEKQYYLH